MLAGRQRKRIYLKAYTDKNIGDDLMIHTFVISLGDEYEIYLCCPVEFQSYYRSLLKNKVILTDVPLRRIHRYGLGFFDLVVSLGGSTLIGRRYKGCYYRLLNYSYLKFLSFFGTKFCIIGCNIGPFANSFMRWFVKLELRSAHFVTCRDKVSFDFIKNSVSRKIEVNYFPDILADVAYKYQISKCNQNIDAPLGVIVHNKMNAQTVSKLIEIIKSICNKCDRGCKVFAFDSGKNESDIKVAEIIRMKLPADIKTSLVINNDEKNILMELAECWKIISIRFHGIVFSLSLGIPVIPIAYSNKHIDYLDGIGYNDPFYTMESFLATPNDVFISDLLNLKNDYIPIPTKLNPHFVVVQKYI